MMIYRSEPDETPVETSHFGNRTLLILAVDFINFVGEYPRISVENSLFFVFL